jgi:MFS family permease
MRIFWRGAFGLGRNAGLLAVCQGLFTCAISVDLTLTGLTGYQLAPQKSLATLPFALITVAGMVTTWFAAQLIHRIGRRAAFTLGASIGGIGGLVSVDAVWHGQFWLFCLGTSAVGVFQAFAQYYRLAAADAVSSEDKGRAVSMVLTGGVVAAILGPALAAWSKDLFAPVLFAGAYLMVAVLGFASALAIWGFYRDGDSSETEMAAVGITPSRPLGVIARQPIFIASLANNVVGSISMMFVMTAAPLAAVACGHSIDDGANIIQWHLVGMYAPSLFAGALIKRFGLVPMLAAGMALNLVAIEIAMSSTSLVSFYASLCALGIGWNFMFVGGTTLLSRSYHPSERARTQGLAELLRYAATALATLAAGPALAGLGWSAVNGLMIPVVVLCAAMTGWWILDQRRQASALPAAE